MGAGPPEVQDFRGYEMVPPAEPVPMPPPSPEPGGAGGDLTRWCKIHQFTRRCGSFESHSQHPVCGLLCRDLGVPRDPLRVGVSARRTQQFNSVPAQETWT
jgi:hypothetical protein